jgi:D-sedoheptulose 7-phosphate isomerase
VSERTDFLYPFIESDERDIDSLLADLSRSARGKAEVSASLRATTMARCAVELVATGTAIARHLEQGAQMFCFGNGGSSTDAASLANLFAGPPTGPFIAGASTPARPVAARSLVDDTAILSAIGNDVGFELIFSRQLLAHSRAGDIAIGLSTSGNSRNLLAAFATAASRGLLTVGIAGYGGGDMARSSDIHHCLVVDDESVHRIQESQAAIGYELWRQVQAQLETAITHGMRRHV